MTLNHVRTCSLISAFFFMVSVQPRADAGEVQMSEYLDHDWTNELVFFPLPADCQGAAAVVVTDSEGISVPCQLTEDGRVAFMVDLPAGSRKAWSVVAGQPPELIVSDLKSDFTTERLRLWNDLVGFEVPTDRGEFAKGPLSAIRLRSGKWAGASRLVTKKNLKSYKADVTATGPVYAEITCVYEFDGGASWKLTFRIISGEPVVSIEESFNLQDDSNWEFVLSEGFSPTAFTFRNTMLKHPGRKHDATTVTVLNRSKPDTPLILHAWLPWWRADAVTFFGAFEAQEGIEYTYDFDEDGPVKSTPLQVGVDTGGETEQPIDLETEDLPLTTRQHRGDQGDVFFAAAGHASRWAEAGKKDGPKKGVPIRTDPNGEVFLSAQLRGPGRSWIFGTSTVENTVLPNSEMAEPQACYIKHCVVPLDTVNAMTLAWDTDRDLTAEWPRIFIRKDEIAPVAAKYQENLNWGSDRKKLYWRFLTAPTPEIKQQMRQRTLQSLAHYVGNFTKGQSWRGHIGPSPTKGTVHFCEKLQYLMFEVDITFGSDIFTPAERARIRSQLAFLAHSIASPDYYDLGRDYRANPNMTTLRHTSVGLLGCLLRQHPKSQEWYDIGWHEIDRELNEYAGPNGGWIECPHYQTLMHSMLLFLVAAEREGIAEDVYDPRLLKSALFLAKIHTPRDRSFHNLRHFPAVGDTPRYELSMLPSMFAKVHRDRNPEAANALQWVWKESGSPHVLGIGGDAMPNYLPEFLVAQFEPDGPPDWTSELFPIGGAVLRSGFPSDRETHMHFYAGMIWSHYSTDNGSFILFGKGQPLVQDWGYKGIKPAWWHSKMERGNLGYIKEFSTFAAADYLRYENREWQRQVLFVKRQDPMAPNYYVLRDFVAGAGEEGWNLWLYTDKVPKIENGLVRAVCRGDVDLDVWLPQEWLEQLPRMTTESAEFINNPADRTSSLARPLDAADTEDDDLEALLEGGEPEKPPYVETRAHSYSNATGHLRAGNSPAFKRYAGGGGGISQRALHLDVPRNQALAWALYPRMRSEKPAAFSTFAEGKGLQIKTPAGVDYVFLDLNSFEYARDNIAFSGKAGSIQVNETEVVLTLSGPGMISYGTNRLESAEPSSKTFPR